MNTFASQIHCLGLSYRTAPIELREQLNYTPDELAEALARARESYPYLRELVILSTCNRLELYAYTENVNLLRDFLAETRGICARRLDPHLFHCAGLEAARHLCRVAAGLDSMVLGEPQILGQVKSAHEAAIEQKTVGTMLRAAFRTAVRAGKRARTETKISRQPVSVSSAAVQLATRTVGDLTGRRVLVVGAGQMAQLAVKVLLNSGVSHVTLANRNANRAHKLAAQWGIAACGLDRLSEALAAADVVFSATGAPTAVITAEMIAPCSAEKPLTLIDLAVPRDVAPPVAQLPNVCLYDVDDLRSQADAALAEREKEIPHVEAIIAEEMDRLAQRLRQATVRPLITGLHRQAEEIRQRELARTLKYLPELDEETRRHVEHLSQSLVKKLLHEPTLRLREEAVQGRAEMHAESVRYLFGLESP